MEGRRTQPQRKPGQLTVAEVAERLGVTDVRVKQLLRKGRLSGVKSGFGSNGGVWWLDEAEVERFAATPRPTSRRITPVVDRAPEGHCSLLDAGKLLGCSDGRVRQLVVAGALRSRHSMVGHRRRTWVERASMDEYLAAMASGAPPRPAPRPEPTVQRQPAPRAPSCGVRDGEPAGEVLSLMEVRKRWHACNDEVYGVMLAAGVKAWSIVGRPVFTEVDVKRAEHSPAFKAWRPDFRAAQAGEA